jgi:hypothetical protein
MWPDDFLVQLPIEPAVPNNFVFRNIPSTIDPRGGFLWGPKEVLDSIDFSKPETAYKDIKESILICCISWCVSQNGPDSFLGIDRQEASFEKLHGSDLLKKTYQWGQYPVFSMNGKIGENEVFSAWIGLQYCTHALFVHLGYPHVEGRPNKEDRALWQTFLSETKALPEPDGFIAQGFHMEPGYTLFEKNGAKLTCIAERRKSDNTVQLVVIPRDKDVTADCLGIARGLAGTAWRRGDEIVKFMLDISRKIPEGGSIEFSAYPITVFLKTVDTFSLREDILEGMKGVFVKQQVMEPIQDASKIKI